MNEGKGTNALPRAVEERRDVKCCGQTKALDAEGKKMRERERERERKKKRSNRLERQEFAVWRRQLYEIRWFV